MHSFAYIMRPSFRATSLSAFALASFALFAPLTTGCAVESGDEAVDEASEDLTDFGVTLKAAGAGAWDATVSRSKFACSLSYEGAETKRVTCTKGSQLLEILVKAGDGTIVAHWPTGRFGSAKTFHTCTKSGSAAGLPGKLTCKKATLRPRPGGLSSPFDSEVAMLPIPNTQQVGTDTGLLRSMAPRSDADYTGIQTTRIGAVLVFKNQTGTGHDVEDELRQLSEDGLATLHVPFAWKDLPSFKESCEQTVDALSYIQTQRKAGKKVLFHCTVGEDRTGYLAALQRELTEAGSTPAQLFQDEMCEGGYGAGNPLKPGFVISTLERGMTPLYRKMSYLVKTGRLTTRLSKTACADDPANAPAFESDQALAADKFKCGTSTRFVP